MTGIKNSDYNLLDALFGRDGQSLGVYCKHPLNEDVKLQLPEISDDQAFQGYDIVVSQEDVASPKHQKQSFYYFCNPDGTMRWIYPAELKKPTFLAFYNSNYYKAKIIKFGFKLAFLLGQQAKISTGMFHVYSKEGNKMDQLFGNGFRAYSVFTGTVGSSRKFVIETHQNGSIDRFVKMGITSQSNEYILQEYHQLSKLNNMDDSLVRIPKVELLEESGIISLTNVQPKKTYPTNDFKEKHAKALLAFFDVVNQSKSIEEMSLWQRIQTNLNALNAFKNPSKLEYAPQIIEALNAIEKSLDKSQSILTSLAHNDFTPWNAYVGKQQIHIYDWEMAVQDAPILLDLFHFVFQSNVLLKHKGYENIKEEIKAAIELNDIHQILQSSGLPYELYLKLYLLDNVTYYLNRYLHQEQLHMQANWLIKVWHDALQDLR